MKNSGCVTLLVIVAAVIILTVLTPDRLQDATNTRTQEVHAAEVADLSQTIRAISADGVKAQQTQADAIIKTLAIVETAHTAGELVPWLAVVVLALILANRITAPRKRKEEL